MEIECFFERLATPRPAPKVTLKSNWQTQQQQQPNLEDDVQSIWKQRATWESRAGVRDDTKHATEVERATRKLALPTTEAEAETHLTVKEEHIDTIAKKIERINPLWFEQNMYSRRPCEGERWCSAKNPAKPFSKWAMWNSLNRANQRSNAPHVFTTYLKEHFFAIVVSN